MTKRFQNVVRRAAPLTAGLLLLASFAAVAPAALGQALPAAQAAPVSTGFTLPRAAGTLQYAVSAGESLTWGYYGDSGADSATGVSGDVAYISAAKADFFSMVFSGGHSWTTSGQPSYSFLNLALSQVIQAGRWNIIVADSVSYLPETSSTGLSGVPGAGDLGITPVQIGEDTGQGVLTNYSTRVINSSTGSVQRALTGKTSVTASGTYSILRFLDDSSGSGLDSDQAAGGAGISHRIDARNTFGGNYSYSKFTYSTGGEPGFTSQTASALFTHQFTRKFGVSASAGPQWTEIGSSGGTQSVTAFADVAATYAGEFCNATVAYTRSNNSGYGVTVGALSDSVVGIARRTFARVWSGAVTGSYTRTASLPSASGLPFSFDTKIGGLQFARALARSFSVYASYTIEDQTHQNAAGAVDLFDGLAQVVAFGLTYSPTALHFGRQ
ncbi:MAG: hypothetical protein ABR910_14800 [Acidobacteriaceae bacterium]|jgi:hypothetical protein